MLSSSKQRRDSWRSFRTRVLNRTITFALYWVWLTTSTRTGQLLFKARAPRSPPKAKPQQKSQITRAWAPNSSSQTYKQANQCWWKLRLRCLPCKSQSCSQIGAQHLRFVWTQPDNASTAKRPKSCKISSYTTILRSGRMTNWRRYSKSMKVKFWLLIHKLISCLYNII